MSTLDVVLPVYNEEKALSRATRALWSFCQQNLEDSWRIIIADNASEDGTLRIADQLAREIREVSVIHLDRRGRGMALNRAWTESDADYRCYMDVDLSSDLSYLPPLINALRRGYDISVGSRLMPGARTTRSLFRSVLSRGYNDLLRLALRVRFSDAQCGFKAITRRVATELLPDVRSERWFFDTELLVLAERAGYRIMDLPIRWVEDRDSRVQVATAIVEDLLGVMELRWRLAAAGHRRPTAHADSREGRH